MQRVLIANRGEIAVRIIRACHQLGLTAIAVYSDIDKAALHVQLADEAYPLGAAAPQESYLNIPQLITVARQCRADAIHPGYGFLSERAAFAKAVADAGFIFVGPSATVIEQMGSKVAARELAQKLKIPTLPGTPDPIFTVEDALTHAQRIGFPILLKASGGGGGKGMRLIRSTAELSASFAMAQQEALNGFGDPAILVEKFLEHPHHVEIQILGDQHGNVVHCFERECSLQRRHQKIIEEAPSPFITPKTRKALCDAAVRLAKSVGYVSAGTVECLVTNTGDWYFLEMNTRIQVEHPVTEMTTGIDLVAWQLRIARGETLAWTQKEITQTGHALECRIYAEDPFQNFMPSPGKITHLQEPQGPFVRVDSGITAHTRVPVEYDPILSKLTVWGTTRGEAVARLQQALQEYQIAGIRTNLPLHRLMMTEADFTNGRIHTQWLDQHLARLVDQETALPPELAVVSAAAAQQQQGHTVAAPTTSAWQVNARHEGLRS